MNTLSVQRIVETGTGVDKLLFDRLFCYRPMGAADPKRCSGTTVHRAEAISLKIEIY
jgi:hypothetical protein